MSSESSIDAAGKLTHQRLATLLLHLSNRKFTQNEAAEKAGIAPQVLSDIKRGRRPLTELIARRLGETFGVNHKWLLAESDESSLSSELSDSASGRGIFLPLFAHPIEGDPRDHPKWDGVGVEIAGPAAAKLATAKWPYLLRFERNDREGRLQRGDLLLVSQAHNPHATIYVVRRGRGTYLARRSIHGDGWTRVAVGEEDLPASCPSVGYCLGIAWAAL